MGEQGEGLGQRSREGPGWQSAGPRPHAHCETTVQFFPNSNFSFLSFFMAQGEGFGFFLLLSFSFLLLILFNFSFLLILVLLFFHSFFRFGAGH